MTGRRNQRGVSLIEALVAMLVLALGVMGMAAVQTRSLTAARTTHLRTLAMQAVDDLRDRMQANSEVRLSPTTWAPYLTSWHDALVVPRDCMSLPCNGMQLAAFDLGQWKSDLARALPDGDALVFSSDKDPTQIGVLVAWNEGETRAESLAGEEEARLHQQAVAARDAHGQLGTGVADKECPAGRTCHLVYIRP